MIPACTRNECAEGRKACPCPDACELPEPSEYDELADWFEDMASAGVTLLKWFVVIVVAVLLAALSLGS